MSKSIIFYYDFVSPYSYLAFSQRHDIARRTGLVLELKPISVGMLMEKVGNVPTSLTCKPKRAYQGQDLARWVKKQGVPFAVHPRFGQFSTTPLIKAALKAGNDVEAFSEAAFAAVWAEQAPVEDPAAMRTYFAEKSKRFEAYWLERDQMESAHSERIAEAASRGVFGVPFFHTEFGDFFGNDRIDQLVEAVTA